MNAVPLTKCDDSRRRNVTIAEGRSARLTSSAPSGIVHIVMMMPAAHTAPLPSVRASRATEALPASTAWRVADVALAAPSEMKTSAVAFVFFYAYAYVYAFISLGG